MTESVMEKAVRLLAEGRVEPKPDMPVRLYLVDGDHGTYQVVVGATVAMCSCPALGRSCSHIKAVIRRDVASLVEAELMDELLKVRKQQVARKADEIFARVGAIDYTPVDPFDREPDERQDR